MLKRLNELKSLPSLPGVGYSEEIQKIEAQLAALQARGPAGDAWKRVEKARHQQRPQTLDYVTHAFADFMELKGDRLRADDQAIIGGMAALDGRTIMLMGHQKGHDPQGATGPQLRHGPPRGLPQGAAPRALAERFRLPVVTLVDTPGAYPGVGAEEGGQARGHRQDACSGLGAVDRAHRGVDHRRGRLGRSPRAGRRRPRAHARERHLLGHHARGLRRHPLARRRRAAGRRGAAPDGARAARVGRHRRGRARAARRRAARR